MIMTETCPPNLTDKCFENASHHIIASAKLSLAAAAEMGKAAGCEVVVLSDAIEGEAAEIGLEHSALIHAQISARPLAKPVLILSGGETSVSIEGGLKNAGKGGAK